MRIVPYERPMLSSLRGEGWRGEQRQFVAGPYQILSDNLSNPDDRIRLSLHVREHAHVVCAVCRTDKRGIASGVS